ncbi:SAGA-associated factor 29 [Folsomia candida]|uniref:SAGA-associated factor 29 n=1 Tax=Folsomia candida TaxID=158441 RepID=UPI000B8FF71C|nr:SAGA-associated factor 29 [Folsomia candida]
MADNYLAQIQDRFRSIHSLVIDVADVHTKNGNGITAVTKIHEKARRDDKITVANKQKLKNLYATTISEAEGEEQLIRKALEKVYEIRSIKNDRRIQAKSSGNKETIRRGALMKALQTSAQTLPLWIGKPGEKPPPLCGSIAPDANYVSKFGDMVAALQRSPEGDENWILAEVVSYNGSTQKYEVDDIDEEQKERLALSKRRVTPLPLMRANPETDPDALYPKDTIVMALYPQTTCFYKAVVNVPPLFHNDEYEVLFEDSSYSEGFSPPLKVAQRYVIAIRDKKTIK